MYIDRFLLANKETYILANKETHILVNKETYILANKDSLHIIAFIIVYQALFLIVILLVKYVSIIF